MLQVLSLGSSPPRPGPARARTSATQAARRKGRKGSHPGAKGAGGAGLGWAREGLGFGPSALGPQPTWPDILVIVTREKTLLGVRYAAAVEVVAAVEAWRRPSLSCAAAFGNDFI